MKYFSLFVQILFIFLINNCGIDYPDPYQESLQGIWMNEGATFIFKDSLAKSTINRPFRTFKLSSDTLKIQNFIRDGFEDYVIIRKTEKTLWLLKNLSDTIALKKHDTYTSDNIKLEKLIIRFDQGTIQLPIWINYTIEINSNKLCYYGGDVSNNILANRIGIPEDSGYYEGVISDKEYDYLQNLLIDIPLGSIRNYYEPWFNHHNVIDIIFYLRIKGKENIERLQTTINGYENIPFELGIFVSYLLEVNRYVNLSKTNIKHKFEL